MTDKIYFHTKILTKDVCKSCQRRFIITKTKYEKLVEKFNLRYGTK